ncbi:MAG: CBS domain-containing protein [Acidimicrobiia bacterium]
MKLRDLMTRDVITVGPDASLKEAARRMLEGGVSGLPVTQGDGSLVGIITEADFVRTEADRRRKTSAGLLGFIYKEVELPSQERLVGDVMSTNLIVLGPEADHAEAARMMQSGGVKRIPVVGEDGRVVGLVSRSDILRVFARTDQEILEEIQGHLIGKVLWIDPKRVEIRSTEGNVVLRGRLETRSDAELLAKLTARVDGVVSVANHLDFETDNTKLETTSPRSWIGTPKSW